LQKIQIWPRSKSPGRSRIRIQNPESRIQNPESLRVIACTNPEAEATFAAREILKFVRANKANRFRDCAVLVRQLENYHQALARVFRRYEIPFFLDRREGVAHHPLAELTRNALRTVAFDWRTDDWFAALKAGFTPLPETEIDRLENAALEFGWRGKQWREPLPEENCECLRRILFPPFEKLYAWLGKTGFKPNGAQLAGCLRELWGDLRVEPTLERWTFETENSPLVTRRSSPHQTVWEQMNAWLDNVALAFPNESMSLRDWLPVLEAGLGNLTVGVIPPALDEVLIGAIDRARNPDLKFALVLGVNESVFPAAPAAPVILTNSDRLELDAQNVALGGNQLDQISRERYLGYIACTRASQKLAVTFARQGADGKTLNPSPFIAQLQRIFPGLEVGKFSTDTDWREAQHANELIAPLTAMTDTACLLTIPALKLLVEKLAQLREPAVTENLSPALAEKIYGSVLKSSVSRLEEFAQCPFKFFVHSGLRADERKVFELDARERGSFQHEILKNFHVDLTAEKKHWRDLTPAAARERIAVIANELAPEYREGLLHAYDQNRFAVRMLTAAVQDFVETLVAWMRGQYDFDPAKAELGFGLDSPGLPAWEIKLPAGHTLALRGRIDRIDLHRTGDRALAVVMDYKSSARKLDKVLMEHGVQLQLLAYLAALRQWPANFFGAEKIIPAGVFYVNLRGQFESGSSRAEALADADAARKLAYQHSGRFDAGCLEQLDRTHAHDQFYYRLNKNGGLPSNSTEALPRGEFDALLDAVERQLRNLGEKIFAGVAQVNPYRKGTQTACEYCEYRAACRLDEWTHEWRVLRATKTEETK
jgi:ATP-dependent helicase/nuclease subunit B